MGKHNTGIRRVACLGEAMVELSVAAAGNAPQGAVRLAYAGDTLNTAVYLKRGWPQGEVAYVTALGTDHFSGQMLAFMASEQLDTRYVERRADRVPGLYAISTDAQGERSFTYWRDNSAARTLFSEPCEVGLPLLGQFQLLYFSAITLAILPAGVRGALYGFVRNFRARGGLLAFDSNYRPRLWGSRDEAQREVSRFWGQADIALPSLDDEMALFGDADEQAVLGRLRAAGVRDGALKRGALGPVGLRAGCPPQAFAQAGQVVDTTAAGDSFNAGYLAGYMAGLPAGDCLQRGHQLAMRVIAHPGAIIPS